MLLKALGTGLNLASSPVPEAGRAAALWLVGIALVAALAEGYRLLTNRPTVALVAQVAFLPAFVVLAFAWTGGEVPRPDSALVGWLGFGALWLSPVECWPRADGLG